ncbi:MAG: hypothetical protein CL398_05055 [Acidiferrobacteraceae bacterium]|nr:hypothetical protein [Acidiferrobacteraceae bacterium]|tara:strand:+ start:1238 stop:2206 length:969 start_codon:yes stop_codon:yes gene_type:complete
MVQSSWVLLVSLLLFLVIALRENPVELFSWFNEVGNYQPSFWLHITHLGEFLVTAAFLSILITKWPRLLGPTLISIIIAIASVQGLKHIVDAPRPAAILLPGDINVIAPASQATFTANPNTDYEALIDSRSDLATTWDQITRNPNSQEARYWIPRMDGHITKNRFGIAYQKETNELANNIYTGIYQRSSRSFPSGHTATIVCAITLILLHIRSRKLIIALSGIALTVGASRIIVGVHWPIDVAAGGLLGWTTALLGSHLSRYFRLPPGSVFKYLIALLPITIGILLLTRSSLYPQVALFEDILGLTAILVGTYSSLQLSRHS